MSGELIAAAAESCHLSTGGCGFPAPGKDIFFFDAIAKFTIGQTEFAVTKPMILLWLSVVVVVGFFVMTFRKAKVVPGRMQGVAEYGYLFVRDGIARDTIGKEGDRFVPLLFSFFFFIWMNNLWGIIPFAQIPVTSKFAIPVAFAAIVPVTLNVARSPASSVTVVARLPVPDAAAQLDPASATQVQVGDSKAAGKVSVTLAAVTGLGPRLVTTIV